MKMKRLSFPAAAVLGAALLSLAAPVAQAQAVPRQSVTGFAQITKDEDTDAQGHLQAVYGYLFNESIEGELRLTQRLGGADKYTLLGAGARYYFGGVLQNKTWLPFAHASFNTSFGSGADFKTLRGGVGADVPLATQTWLTLEAAYVRRDQDSPVSRNSNGAELLVGLKFRF